MCIPASACRFGGLLAELLPYLLLLAIATGTATAMAHLVRRLTDPRAIAGTRRGPARGYVRIAPQAIAPRPMRRMLPPDWGWRPLSIETFHRRGRTRSVLRVAATSLPDADALPQRLAHAARTLQSTIRADVAAVELHLNADPEPWDEPAATVVFAPDGRGWTGAVADGEWLVATAGVPPRGMRSMEIPAYDVATDPGLAASLPDDP